MRRAIIALTTLTTACALIAANAWAKLPAPSDEAKAKAAAAAAKTAWTDKVGAYQLCRAMDRTADGYRKAMKAAGKNAPAAVETPACADPGPFVAPATTSVAAAAPAVAPPLEAAGAHSPTKTATAPPSSNATAAELQGKAKK
jgi:hypothetical protein